jgi:hypothetical protein
LVLVRLTSREVSSPFKSAVLQVDPALKVATQLCFKAHGSTTYTQVVVALPPQRLQVIRAGAMGTFVIDGGFDLVLAAGTGTVKADILEGHSTG